MKTIRICSLVLAFVFCIGLAMAQRQQIPRLPSTAHLSNDWKGGRGGGYLYADEPTALLALAKGDFKIELRVTLWSSRSEVEKNLLRWANRPVQTHVPGHLPIEPSRPSMTGVKVASYFVGPESTRELKGGVFQIEAAEGLVVVNAQVRKLGRGANGFPKYSGISMDEYRFVENLVAEAIRINQPARP
jgi:hypothetical protein